MFKKLRSFLSSGNLTGFWQETKWIYRYMRHYRKVILLFIILSLVATGLGLASTVASKYFFDLIEAHLSGNSPAVSTLITFGALCVVLALLNILLNSVAKWWTAKINISVGNEIRADVYQKFLMTDLESLQAFHSGDLLNRINTDVTEVAESVLGWIPSLITKLVAFTATLSIILIYDPTMAIFALISAPVTLLVSKFLMGRMRSHRLKMRAVNAKVMSMHEESLQNVQPIKALNLNEVFYRKILRIQKEYYDTSMDFQRFSVMTSMFMSTMGLVVSYSCLGWAAYRLWTGAITFGSMMLFLQLANYLSSSFSSLVSLVPSAINATVAARRIMSVLELPREAMPDREKAMQWQREDRPMDLVLEDISFRYKNGEQVLDGLDLNVKHGQMVAIVGHSGSGKTTLFRILLGLLNKKGTAQLRSGDQMLPLSPSTRCLFSYVPQDSLLFSGSVADCLRMVREEATDEELWSALRAACAEDFVRKLPHGLNSDLRGRGSSLSGGQIQRLAIARALLSNAPILLLDEVTAALDLETEHRVLANIAAAYKGRTCLISTHRPSVLGLCDQIYRFENGRLVATDAKHAVSFADPAESGGNKK